MNNSEYNYPSLNYIKMPNGCEYLRDVASCCSLKCLLHRVSLANCLAPMPLLGAHFQLNLKANAYEILNLQIEREIELQKKADEETEKKNLILGINKLYKQITTEKEKNVEELAQIMNLM